MATEPNLIDAGANEIPPAPGVLCWIDAGLAAPVRPIHPEVDRIADNRRASATTGIAFLPVEFPRVARFPAQPNRLFMYEFFIAAIVVWAKRWDLLSQWTFKGQGSEPAPCRRVRREAAGRATTALHVPPNWNCLNRAQSTGRLLIPQSSWRFPRCWSPPK